MTAAENKLLDAIFAVVVRPPNDGRSLGDVLLPEIRSACAQARRDVLLECAEWHEKQELTWGAEGDEARAHRDSAAHFRQMATKEPK